jgi:type I restriction enzyme, S subunit
MDAEQLLEHFDRVAEAPGSIAALRRFILDLAVRGKLVDQDPNDEPASELLKQIQLEKARLVKEGILKKGKQFLDVDKNEVNFDIPTNWKWVRIRQVTSDRGQTIPKSDFTYIDVTAINKELGYIADAKTLSASEAPSRARKLVQKNDVIYSCVRPYLLNIAIVDTEIIPPPIASTAFAILYGFDLVLPKYLWVILRSPFMIESVESKMRGQAYPAINDADFAILPMPLPPLAEQHRIVAKVDELMDLCDRLETTQKNRENLRDRLVAASLHQLNQATDSNEEFFDRARFYFDNLAKLSVRSEHIKQLRQTILELAVRGKLISQDPNDEPASKLLYQIQLKRQQLVNNGEMKSDIVLPSVNEADEPFQLPLGWTWARFPEVGIFGRGKSKHRPRNDSSLFKDGTHFFVQTGDVARSHGHITSYSSKYNEIGLAQSKKWPKGTLCITIAANIADSGILSFDACFPDSIVGFIPESMFSEARYFEYFIRTAKANLLEYAPATAQKNINLGILNAVLIPLPPLAEQQRIVVRIDELMALCDRLESQINTTQSNSQKLLESLLNEALSETA